MSYLRQRLGLLRTRDFRRFFAATSVTHLADHSAAMAIPLVAVLALRAGEFEVGLLFALTSAASLVLGLPAGAWVDRLPRRHVLVLSNIARALLFASVPFAWWAGALTIWQLYVVALLRGVSNVFFDVAYQSYLPGLVGRAQLAEANAKLESVRAASQVASPGIAGQFIQAVNAAVALVGNVVALSLATWILLLIRTTEDTPDRRARQGIAREVIAGLRFVLGNRLLAAIAMCSAWFNFWWSAYLGMFILFLVRDLRLNEGSVGLVLSFAGAGGLLGLLVGKRLVGWVGQGPALWLAPLCIGPSALLIPLVARPGVVLWVAACGHLLAFAGIVIYNVTQVSFRQGLTPDHLLGRMNATMRFLVWGTMPLGALAGGVLGQSWGPRPALMTAAVGAGFAFLPVFLSPLRRMRHLPTSPGELAGDQEPSVTPLGFGPIDPARPGRSRAAWSRTPQPPRR